ncbi:MAG: hypothetical protein J6Y82_04930 [Bacteroidales bacterium]|nr:hypothetical protein [Bacteroidales bacterium]
MLRRLLVIILLLISAVKLSAQRAPITITPIFTPPYPASLEAMAERGSTSLMANIIVNDLTVSELPVRLHFKFQQGNTTIESSKTQVVTPMFLGAGEARALFGADFAQYLKLDNLTFSGLTKSQYLKNGRLGDGLWRVSVWLEHVHTGRTISNVGTTVVWLSQCPPPELTSPLEGVETPRNEAEPLIFSWKPSKYTGGAAIWYRFELWEMRVQGTAPQSIAETQHPFYTTETAGTTVTLPSGSIAMQPGWRYCWRVTAYDPQKRISFEKKGQSDIRTFKYLSECPAVDGLAVKVTDNPFGKGGDVEITWDYNPQHTGYNVEVYDDDRSEVRSGTIMDNSISYDAVPYSTSWHVSVQGRCENSRTSRTFSRADFAIHDRPERDDADCAECVCEDPPAPRTITNFDLKTLAEGDVIENKTGRTTFEIVSATEEADGESYRGLLYMNMPIWHCRFLLEYDHLKVNTDNIILSGRWHSMDLPLTLSKSTFEEVEAYIDELKTNIAGATYNNRIKEYKYTKSEIQTVYREGDRYYVYDGEKYVDATETFAGHERMLIADTEGRQYVVNPDGDIMSREEYNKTGGEPILIAQRNAERDAKVGGRTVQMVNFTRDGEQIYGFDAYDGTQPQDLYPTINENSNYRPAYVSMPLSARDRVGQDAPMSVRFSSDNGVELVSNDGYLKLNSPAQERTMAVYGYNPEGDIVGKLNIQAYKEKEINVHLVSVNGAKMPDISTLEQDVNDIFRQAVVKVTIDALDPIEITFANGKSFVHGGKGTFRNYNTDQKTAIQALPASASQDDYYLFFVECYDRYDTEGAKTNELVAGYMPVGRHYGFIYNQYDYARTIAHELAHGALSLSHTFSDGSESYLGEQGTTANLMDYNGGTALNHIQWQWAHETHRNILGFLDDESEAEAWREKGTKILCINDQSVIDAIREYRYFYLPDGQIVDLEKYTPSGFYAPDDVTPEARGAVATLRIDGLDYSVSFTTNEPHKVTGFGLLEDNSKIVPIDGILSNASTVYRVYIRSSEIVIKDKAGNEVKTISYSGDCNCSLPKSSKTYFAESNTDYYVQYAKKHSKYTDKAIYDDETIIDALVNKIDKQKNDSKLQDTELGERIADKLRAYKKLNNKNFIVVKAPVKVLCTNQRSWNGLAKKVFERAGLGDNDILITIPYIQCAGIGRDLGEIYFMPGLYHGNGVEIDDTNIKTNYNNTSRTAEVWVNEGKAELLPIGEFIMDVFKWTKKKLVVYEGIFSATNSVEFCRKEASDTIGYDWNYRILLLQEEDCVSFLSKLKGLKKDYDKSIEDFNELNRNNFNNPHNSQYQNYNYNELNYIKNRINYNYIKRQSDLYEDYLNETQNSALVEYSPENKVDIKEEYLDKYAEDYIQTEAFNELRDEIRRNSVGSDLKNSFPKVGGFKYPEEEHSFKSYWDYLLDPIDEDVFNVIDGVGVVLGFVGLDFISDVASTTYALFRGKYFEASAGVISLLVAGPEGVVIKESLRVGKNTIVKYSEKKGFEVVENVSDDILLSRVDDYVANNTIKQADADKLKELKGEELSKGIEDALNGKKVMTQIDRVESIFKEGEKIGSIVVNGKNIDITIKNIHQGTNGKYALIGRGMEAVSEATQGLEKKVGKNVVILDDTYLNQQGIKLSYNGKDITVEEANNITKEFREYIKRITNDKNAKLTLEQLKDQPMFVIDEQWLRKMKDDGYTIVDIGNPLNKKDSYYYNMELEVMGWDYEKRIQTLLEKSSLSPIDKINFIKEFSNPSKDVLRKFLEKPELVNSWNIIREKHPIDCKDINVLEKVDELRKLAGREEVGFTDEVISDVQGIFFGNSVSTVQYEEVLETCSNFVNAVKSNSIYLDNFSRVIGELSKGQSYSAGAEWTVRYIGKHGNEFAGKKLRFEVNQEVGDKIRRVDLKVYDENLGKNIFYEFKSVKEVPPSNFLEQFGKDLANSEVSDLSQIKWIFDGKKVTQEQLTNAIKKAIDDWTVPADVLKNWNYTDSKKFKQDKLNKIVIETIFKTE